MTFRNTRSIKRFMATCLSLTILFTTLAMAASMDDMLTEAKTKAQTIYKVIQFVGFPEKSFSAPSQPITVCVLGYDSFGKILDYAFKDKKVNGRALNIIRVRNLKTLKKTTESYQVIYITKSLQKEVPNILAHLMGSNCLIMGESPDFCQQGGMIQLKVLAEKARFNINTTAVWQEDLKISSNLLKLATIVKTEPLISKTRN
jgi:hypothetical protein